MERVMIFTATKLSRTTQKRDIGGAFLTGSRRI